MSGSGRGNGGNSFLWKSSMRVSRGIIYSFALVLAAGASAFGAAGQTVPLFETDILPIFQQHCLVCHSDSPQHGLDLRDLERVLKGGESGAAVTPGSSFRRRGAERDRDGHRDEYSRLQQNFDHGGRYLHNPLSAAGNLLHRGRDDRVQQVWLRLCCSVFSGGFICCSRCVLVFPNQLSLIRYEAGDSADSNVEAWQEHRDFRWCPGAVKGFPVFSPGSFQ